MEGCTPNWVLCLLTVIYCLVTGATFTGLFFHYQYKLDDLSERCVKFENFQPSKPSIVQKEIDAKNINFTTSSPHDIDYHYEECHCGPKDSGNNDKEVYLRGNIPSGIGDQEPSQHELPLLRCCSNNDTVLHEKVVQWTEGIDYSSSGTSMVSAISVVGSSSFQIDHRNRNPQIITEWTIGNDREIGFAEGIGLKNGRLIAPNDGYYMVHSKVVFESRGNHRSPSLTIGHSTSVASEGRPEEQPLMHSEKIHCRKSGTNTYSSFHSGIFKLFQEDEVYVTVTVFDNVRVTFNPESSSFGLYLLSTT